MKRWFARNWYRVVAHAIGLAPLAWISFLYAQSADSFTINRDVELMTGAVGLILLLASFACTPASSVFHLPQAIQIRRALGLYGFMYIAIHIFAYAWFDNEFDLELMWRDLGERRAMAIGLVAFALLIPLALTSTRGWKRRLGKNWRVLHRLIYLAAPLSVLHFLLLDRDVLTLPLIYAAFVMILLLSRVPAVRRALRQARGARAPND